MPQPFDDWTDSCKNPGTSLLSGTWPHDTTDKYSFAFLDRQSVIRTESYFYSGLALYKDKLVTCSFFRRVFFDRYKRPVEFAIDPMAHHNGIYPECYIGYNIGDSTLASWRISRERSLAPIEMEYLNVILRARRKKNYQSE